MANITPGQFIGFIPYGLSSAQAGPMRTPAAAVNFVARFVNSMLGAGGDKRISGTTNVTGVAAQRRVVIMTQPPFAKIVYESDTLLPGVAFSFPKLAAGKYLVLDCTYDGSQQALVYDWVVPV